MDKPTKEEIRSWFMGLQDRICIGLENLDGTAKFQQDQWERPEGGGGRSRVIQGEHIEKGGVNFSAVHGHLPERISNALKLPQSDFFATGVSIVLHPKNPMVPIIHMNVRYFETESADGETTYWFGGGIDVTPHYVFKEDAGFFHRYLKSVCDQSDISYYPKFKKWADDYFYIKHRKETRGVGGIFFDRLAADEQKSKQDVWQFVQNVGEAFVPIYSELFTRHSKETCSAEQKEWQKIRRGRYVEFNLVWDKGTKFGLETNGRIESILMSMPPQAEWFYNHQPQEGSAEAETLALLKKEIDWVSF